MRGSFRRRFFSRQRVQLFLRHPARFHPRRHNQGFGFFGADIKPVQNTVLAHALALNRFKPAGQIIRHAAGKIFQCLDVVFAKAHQHGRRQLGNFGQRVFHTHFAPLFGQRRILLVEEVTRAVLNFLRRFIVKAFDIGNFIERHKSHFFNRGKAFRRQ